MSILLIAIIVILLIIVVVTLIHMYNNLVGLRNRVKNSYAQIDVQLKRRNDLIPNLVETVKGYAAHEKGVLEEVTKARTSVMNASNIEEASAEDKISYARQFYNDVVLKYNNACQQFPSSIIAGMFGFNEEEFFKAPETERAVPEVKFE